MVPQVEVFRVIHPANRSALSRWSRARFSAVPESDVLQTIHTAGNSLYAVRSEGDYLGFYALAEQEPSALRIRDFLFADGEEQTADRVLEYLLTQAGDAGYPEVQIALPEESGKWIALFRGHGFKLTRGASGGTLLLRRKMQ